MDRNHRPRGRANWIVLSAAVSISAAVVAMWWVFVRDTAVEQVRLPEIDASHLDPWAARLVAEARAAVQAAPTSADCWGTLGHILWAQDLQAEAATCYGWAERFDSRDVRWPYLRGLCLERHDATTSLACLRRAASLTRNLAVPHVQLAEMLLERELLDEAEECLNKAESMAPSDSRVLLAKGRLAFMRHRDDEALHWTSLAAQLDPSRRRIRILLSQIYQRRGDTQAVEEQLRVLGDLPAVTPYYEWPDPLLAEAARFKKDVLEVTLQAQQLIDAGNPRQAIHLLNEMGGRDARDVQVVIMLGKAYAHLPDSARAEELLLHARQRDPGQAPVHNELGNLARLAGRYREAVEHYEQAVRIEPEYAIAYYYLSASRLELGDAEGAIASLRLACRCRSGDLRLQRELAQLLWRCGRREEALDQLQEALRIAPDDSATRLLFDQLHSKNSLSKPADDVHSQSPRDPS